MGSKLGNKILAAFDEGHCCLFAPLEFHDFKDYLLAFIFYRYLSEKLQDYLDNELKEDKLTFQEAYEDEDYRYDLQDYSLEELGYYIEPQFLFSAIAERSTNREFILDKLLNAFDGISESIIDYDRQNAFTDIFEFVDLDSLKLGRSFDRRNELISRIINILSYIDFESSNEEDETLGETFEYLVRFGVMDDKERGEFHTPPEVSKLIAKLVTINKNALRNVYDPICGPASLLLKLGEEARVSKFYGQELNQKFHDLACMNMLIHEVDSIDFDIKQGDSLENPMYFGKKFEAIVSDIPSSIKWSADWQFLKDERFVECGILAPKSKAEYAFLQHMLYHLEDDGTMAVVWPYGSFSKSPKERHIMKYLIEDKNFLDAVIKLPRNLFYETKRFKYLLIFKKSRLDNQDIFFIDASKDFKTIVQRRKHVKNRLRDEDIERIVNTYANRDEIKEYSYKAPLDEIKENNFILNAARYVD